MNGDYIGALILVALAALACLPTVRHWDAQAEERRRVRDLAKWQRQIDEAVQREADAVWAATERAVGMEPFPAIGPGQAAHIFRHQLDDPEAVERFTGGAA